MNLALSNFKRADIHRRFGAVEISSPRPFFFRALRKRQSDAVRFRFSIAPS